MPCNHLSAISSRTEPVLEAMFEARKRVFVDLLKWDVPVLDSKYEVDQFDTPDATYLIVAGERGRHWASARLLRTDQPHILGQLFPYLCDGPAPSGDATREITRFCIDPRLARENRRLARNRLVTALVEHAIAHKITDYTAVANVSWFRQIEAFGWNCQALGPHREVGGELLVALHIRIDADTPDRLAANGIHSTSVPEVAYAGALQ